MKHTRAALFAGLTLTAASVGAFVPAHAADTGDTTTTFSITAAGGLSITAPATGTLQDRTSGQLSTTGTLGSVEVKDERGALTASWTATAASTAFVNQTDTTKTIAASNLAYLAAPAASLGTGVPAFVAGAMDATDPLLRPKVTYTGVGNSTVTWDPDLTLTIPGTTPVGQYKATITHSVS